MILITKHVELTKIRKTRGLDYFLDKNTFAELNLD